MKDLEILKLIKLEEKRQKEYINLIASENFVSVDVLKAVGSCLTNKYAEGYPFKRYYGGTEIVDKLEELVKKRALKAFKLKEEDWAVNLQAYSGTPANLAIYFALVPLKEKIMSLKLEMGGHLSHGARLNVASKLWNFVYYQLDEKTEELNYQKIEEIALKEKPKLIITGYSAYSKIIDFKKFKAIAKKVNALLLVDMSHFAGLVLAGFYPSPFLFADVVMTTTHKTLKGPRGAIIFTRKIFVKEKNAYLNELIDKVIFPGMQGGPHLNIIAGIGVALFEALKPSYKKYISQVIKNAKVLAEELKKYGWRIVANGTETHLFLVDVGEKGINGKLAQEVLEKNKIVVNKNLIPFDKNSAFSPSGIRIGTAFITAQGKKEKDMKKIAFKINKVLNSLREKKYEN